MLDKERWIYDPARCLRKTCKYPMLADTQLGGYFIKGHKPITLDDDEEKADDSDVVPPIQATRRSRKFSNKAKVIAPSEEKDGDDSSVTSVVAGPEPKRRCTSANLPPIPPPKQPPTPRNQLPLPSRSALRRSSASTTTSSSSSQSSTPQSATPSYDDDMIGNIIEKHMNVFVGVMLRNQKDIIDESQRHMEGTMKDALKKHQAEIASLKASIGLAQRSTANNRDQRATPMSSPSLSSGVSPNSKDVSTRLNQSKYVIKVMKLYVCIIL